MFSKLQQLFKPYKSTTIEDTKDTKETIEKYLPSYGYTIQKCCDYSHSFDSCYDQIQTGKFYFDKEKLVTNSNRKLMNLLKNQITTMTTDKLNQTYKENMATIEKINQLKPYDKLVLYVTHLDKIESTALVITCHEIV